MKMSNSTPADDDLSERCDLSFAPSSRPIEDYTQEFHSFAIDCCEFLNASKWVVWPPVR